MVGGEPACARTESTATAAMATREKRNFIMIPVVKWGGEGEGKERIVVGWVLSREKAARDVIIMITDQSSRPSRLLTEPRYDILHSLTLAFSACISKQYDIDSPRTQLPRRHHTGHTQSILTSDFPTLGSKVIPLSVVFGNLYSINIILFVGSRSLCSPGHRTIR
jgi:hypothetical protein